MTAVSNYARKQSLKLISVILVSLVYFFASSFKGINNFFLPDIRALQYYIDNNTLTRTYATEYLYLALVSSVKSLLNNDVNVLVYNFLITSLILISSKKFNWAGIVVLMCSFAFFSGIFNQFRAFLCILLIFTFEKNSAKFDVKSTMLALITHLKIGVIYFVFSSLQYILKLERTRKIVAAIALLLISFTFFSIFKNDIERNITASFIQSYLEMTDGKAYLKLFICAIILAILPSRTDVYASAFSPFLTFPILSTLTLLVGQSAVERIVMALLIYYSLIFCSQINSFRMFPIRVFLYLVLNFSLIVTSRLLG